MSYTHMLNVEHGKKPISMKMAQLLVQKGLLTEKEVQKMVRFYVERKIKLHGDRGVR